MGKNDPMIPGLRSVSALLFLLCWLVFFADASIHFYTGERFISRGNAFVVHGGSEGIASSTADNGDGSYIT